MTEKKKLPKQGATYNNWAVTEKDPIPPGNRSDGSNPRVISRAQRQQERWHQEGGRGQHESIGTSVRLRRIVTVPQADPSYAGNTFIERQRLRRERAQSRANRGKQTQYVARTLAQTGTRASTGRVSVVSRPLPSQPSPVPIRSGQQRPKRGRFWRFLGFFTIVAMVIVVGSFLLTGDAFRIAQVRVVETSNEDLIQRIENMGIKGQNIFLLDVPSVIKEIDALPEVETADLGKQLPNQLVVSIKERVPVLLWQAPNGTFSVDSEGMVIATADKTVGADHLGVVIEQGQQTNGGKPEAALRPGVRISKTEVAFALAILQQLPTVIEQGQQTNGGNPEAALRPGMRISKTEVAFAPAVLQQLPIVNGESVNSYKLYYSGTIYSDSKLTSGENGDSGGSYTLESVVAGWKAYLGGADDANPLSNRFLELRSILALAKQDNLKVATIDLRHGLNPVYTLQS